ncbi:hypothetical protein MMC13_005954 [Lambiella insularis]|nr:hypothetical protein [Lambiella insularis]
MSPREWTPILKENISQAKEVLAQVPKWQWLILGVGLTFIYASVRCVYCLYFHPLARFPGPRIAAVSNIWYGYHWIKGRYPWAVESALKQYGDVVRVSPNEICFITPQSYTDIYTHTASRTGGAFIKTKFQDIGEKELGITAERDPEKHRVVRKALNPGFNPRTFATREPVLHEHIDRFVGQLAELGTTGKGVNMIEWCDWLAWDLAGDLAYSRHFDNVKYAKDSLFLSLFKKVGLWGTISQVLMRFPLIKPVVWLLVPPSVAVSVPTLLKMNRKEVQRRVTSRDNLDHPDYFEYLIPKGAPEPSEDWLLAQANVLVVAGFDPSTNLLSSAIYYLLKEPDTLLRLVKEVREAFSKYEGITFDQLPGLKYLHAVLEESLRIHTNAGFGLPRICPGSVIDGHFVPKGAVVQTCFYATTHSERYFKKARRFCPERWLPPSHPYHDSQFDNDNKSAFNPFSLGPRGCPGIHVSYQQARAILAKLLWAFDMEMTNRDEIDWERDCKLHALWVRPPVMVKFTHSIREE